jgi:hypothetical protein
MESSKKVLCSIGFFVVVLMLVLCFSVSYAQNKEKPIKDKLITEETTWSPNYKDESVDVVAAKFGKQFDKKIIVSSSIKGKKISLALTKSSFDDALKAITQPQGWQYIQDGNTITLMTRDEYQTEMKQRIATKTYTIKFNIVQNVAEGIQSALSSSGTVRMDKLNNQLIVTDSPDVLAEVDKLIANLDVPVETKIIPIQYSNIVDLGRFLNDKVTRRGTVTTDRKSNLIISDTPENLIRMEALVTQFEESARALPQVNIDCSIIKIALNQKYLAGIDWTTCPFLARDIRSQTGVYLNNVDQNKLLEWLKSFGEPELISRKKTTVVPGNQAQIREGSQYSTVVSYPTGNIDTAGKRQMATTKNTVDSGFTYSFTVQPTINKTDRIIQLDYRVDGVLPESGNRITYQVSIDNTRIKDGYTLITEDIRRMPIGTSNLIAVEEQEKLKYGSMDLILLITPRILESEMSSGK